MANVDTISLKPIGLVENAALNVADVPSEGLPSTVRLFPEFTPALQGIEVGDHVYVITEFHEADPSVLHGSPGTDFQQGAFSIRSSSRPNRIGMTLSVVTAVAGDSLGLEWLDFSHGSPVLDIKRYNWRWECVLSARRLDRRLIERQIARTSLIEVLARAAVNLHGEKCEAVTAVAQLAASLVQDQDVWLGSHSNTWHVRGDGHVIDAIQGITGATLGNGRLSIDLDASSDAEVTVRPADGPTIHCRRQDKGWEFTAPDILTT